MRTRYQGPCDPSPCCVRSKGACICTRRARTEPHVGGGSDHVRTAPSNFAALVAVLQRTLRLDRGTDMACNERERYAGIQTEHEGANRYRAWLGMNEGCTEGWQAKSIRQQSCDLKL